MSWRREIEAGKSSEPRFCNGCQRIDLANVFSTDKVALKGLFSRKVYTVVLTDLPTSCAFCRLLWYARYQPATNSTYDVWAASLLKVSSEVRQPKIIQKAFQDLDQVCLFVTPTEIDQEEVLLDEGGLPYIASYNASQLLDNESDSYSIRRIDETANHSLIKHWINTCHDEHTDCCSQMAEKEADVEHMRLIDVQRRKIVESSPGATYVTLSYVWGTNTSHYPSGWRCKPGTPLPELLPQTIHDAIDFVKNLGYRYLWVDQYCIDQDDVCHKARQISAMHRIYSGSELTIIAAAGSNCEYGLPGASPSSPARKGYQEVISKGDIALINSPARPENAIYTSTWASRGWTYQEGLLARRRLLFTDEQVYFECGQTYVLESLRRPIRALYGAAPTSAGHPPRKGLRIGYFQSCCINWAKYQDLMRGTEMDMICAHLRAFLMRNLTHSSDTLNAFVGVLNSYAPHFHGLPLTQPELPMEYQLARSLSWLNGGYGKSLRRPELPSFTWAGWTEYPLLDRLEVKEMEARFLNLHDWTPGQREPREIIMEAPIVTVYVQWDSSRDCLATARDPAGCALMEPEPKPYITIPALFRDLETRQVGREVEERYIEVEVECIRMFTGDGWDCLLAIERHGDYVERIGTVELDPYRGSALYSHREIIHLR